MHNRFFPDNLKDWVNIVTNVIMGVCAIFVLYYTALYM